MLRFELLVGLDARRFLARLQQALEAPAVDAEHDLAEHGDEAAVAVEGEALVAGGGGQPFRRLVVEPEVEDRIHHARHRHRRSRAHRDEQRVGAVAQPLAAALLQHRQRLADLRPERLLQHAAGAAVIPACFRRDGEAGGTGTPAAVISARPAPLPPSSCFMSARPSSNA